MSMNDWRMGMRTALVAACLASAVVGLAACRKAAKVPAPAVGISLLEAREGFQTQLREKTRIGNPAPDPPANLFEMVHYPAPVGDLVAYVSKTPEPTKRLPAIIWLVGGFGSGVSEVAWERGEEDNDQSARAFREAGIVLMLPSYRGGNTNPGYQEGFFGEVDDVLAAVEFLAKRPEVDPERIYLGGHSTGGTLALLVAASTDRFRAVFSFGPTASTSDYGQDYLPYDILQADETRLRAPIVFLNSITSPTFVFEGTNDPTNIDALREMKDVPHGAVRFHPVTGRTHFSVLAPMTKVIARKILADQDGIKAFTKSELGG
jgi:dienelactone hydrolase